MKIGIIGASGKAGRLILKEAVNRGHEVTAIVRDASKVQSKQVKIIEKSILDLETLDVEQFDVIVNAFNAAPGQEHLHYEAGNVLIDTLIGTPSTRLVVVGGAGSLFVDEAKSVRVMETPEFPKEYLPTAINMSKNLEKLKNNNSINWTYISPGGFFDPDGKRTGSYQTGGDKLILNLKGETYISYADYAIAVLDEIEKPNHENVRFSVVGETE